MSDYLGTLKGVGAGAIVAVLIAALYLSGCVHTPDRESQKSRNRLDCIYKCKFEKNLSGPALDPCFKGCN